MAAIQFMIPGSGFINETEDVDKQYMIPGSGYLSESGGGGEEPPEEEVTPGLFFANG